MNNKRKSIDTFFSEKEICDLNYTVLHKDQTHVFSTNVIKELVLNASDNEFKTIKEHLITLDFLNGDIHHFLKSLAEAYIKKNF